MKIWTRVVLLLVPLLLIIAGCDRLISAFSGDRSATDEARLVVKMVDDALDEIEHAYVTITGVAVVGQGGVNWISEVEQEYDLVELQDGYSVTLATAAVAPGMVHQLRIRVAQEARVIFVDGTESVLKVPGGHASGIKILFPAMELDGAADAEVTVDFDLSESFIKAGNSGKWIFKPVLKPHEVLLNGVSQELPPYDADEEEDEEDEDEEDE